MKTKFSLRIGIVGSNKYNSDSKLKRIQKENSRFKIKLENKWYQCTEKDVHRLSIDFNCRVDFKRETLNHIFKENNYKNTHTHTNTDIAFNKEGKKTTNTTLLNIRPFPSLLIFFAFLLVSFYEYYKTKIILCQCKCISYTYRKF